MRKNIFILVSSMLLNNAAFSQISNLECGWNYHYDNAGNRIARIYVDCGGNETDPLVTSGINSPNDTLANVDIFTLYPNPTSGEFRLEFNNELHDAEITVTNNIGQLVYSQKVSGTLINVDLSGKAAGAYHVTVVRNVSKKYTKSVVKTD